MYKSEKMSSSPSRGFYFSTNLLTSPILLAFRLRPLLGVSIFLPVKKEIEEEVNAVSSSPSRGFYFSTINLFIQCDARAGGLRPLLGVSIFLPFPLYSL